MEQQNRNGGPPLGREAILAHRGRRAQTRLDIPELGGTVLLQELTTAERDEYEATILSTRGRNVEVNFRGLRARLIAWSVVDADGARVFNADDPNDLAAIGELGSRGTDRIFAAAQELNGLTREDVETLAGNSPGVPSGAPSTS